MQQILLEAEDLELTSIMDSSSLACAIGGVQLQEGLQKSEISETPGSPITVLSSAELRRLSGFLGRHDPPSRPESLSGLQFLERGHLLDGL